MQPAVSIVIPTYNRARLVVQAIASCADQGLREDCQILVVDDSSSDGTKDAVRGLNAGVAYLETASRSGQAEARNLGLSQARGRWVKFLDSDDVLEPGVLAREIRLGDERRADIVISGWGEVDLDSETRSIESSRRTFPPPQMTPNVVDAVLAGKAVPTSAALYRATSAAQGRWDKPSGNLDDWDWFCQMALRSEEIAALPATSYWMRSHRGERVSASLPMLANARSHQHILGRIEASLREHGLLTPDRRRRLAQYYYKELRVLCLNDRPEFEAAVSRIRELDPGFVPRDEERQAAMRLAGRLLGFRRATLWHSALKRAVGRH